MTIRVIGNRAVRSNLLNRSRSRSNPLNRVRGRSRSRSGSNLLNKGRGRGGRNGGRDRRNSAPRETAPSRAPRTDAGAEKVSLYGKIN
jgi:hypothetical protein